MKLKFWLVALISIVFSCSEESSNEDTKDTLNSSEDITLQDIRVNSDNFESFVRRKVENILKINASENYDLEIVEAYLDKDTLKDALILINREEYALEKAKKEGKEKVIESLGYTSNENYVYVFRGASEKVLTTPGIGSSIFHSLKAGLDEITSPGQNDFWVDYRIRNSMYRNYYAMRGDKLFLTLSCPVFDDIGEPEPKAFYIEHREVEPRISKDIVLFDGEIANYNASEIEDPYDFSPEAILPTDSINVYFIFDPSRMKYVTPMNPPDEDE